MTARRKVPKGRGPSARYEEALRLADEKPSDLGKVAAMLGKAHSAGDLRATYALATWYLHGRHFRRNLKYAIALLRRAADGGVAEALYDLGASYELGIGVAKNHRLAVSFYMRAALAGDADGLEALGRCFYHGMGCPVNHRLGLVCNRVALEWARAGSSFRRTPRRWRLRGA